MVHMVRLCNPMRGVARDALFRGSRLESFAAEKRRVRGSINVIKKM
jgi:hypothetical protein